MATLRKLCIGMSLAPTWLRAEGWRQPDSNIEGLFTSDFTLDVARRAEAAHLDFVFRPDTLHLPLEMLEQSFGFTSLDSMMLMAAIARETSRIGLVATVSPLSQQPYAVARQITSLDWLSKGRACLNLMTAPQGQENFGLEDLTRPEDRQARIAEFTEVLLKLCDSFPAEALLVDRTSGRYADTAMIHPIEHQGRHFRVKGPLNLPAHPGPRIPLMQAGLTATGRDLAAATMDLIFTPTPDLEAARELRDDLSARARAQGRDPAALRLLPGLGLYLGRTREEARDLYRATHARVTMTERIARIRAATGLDLSDWPENRPVTEADLPATGSRAASLGQADLLRRLIRRGPLLKTDLLDRHEVFSVPHWHIIGTVDDAVAEIRHWHASGSIDGFVIAPGGSTASMHMALEQMVPRLAEAGIFRAAYSADTLAGHLAETD